MEDGGGGGADEFDGGIIEKGDEIPEYIPRFCLEEEAPLPDCKLPHIHMSGKSLAHVMLFRDTHLWLRPEGPYSGIHRVLLPFILVGFLHLTQRRPRLPRRRDELAWILCSRISVWRRGIRVSSPSVQCSHHRFCNVLAEMKSPGQTESHRHYRLGARFLALSFFLRIYVHTGVRQYLCKHLDHFCQKELHQMI